MFEDSLMESQNRLSSPNQRWTTILSLTLQCAVAVVMLALPLLHLEVLPFRIDAPKIILPLKLVPPPAPSVEASLVHLSSTSYAESLAARAFTAPTMIPQIAETTTDQPPALDLSVSGMGDSNSLRNTLAVENPRPGVIVSQAKTSPKGVLHISTGVSTGLLLAPIRPIYPSIAAMAGVEGTVIVEAVISKSGHIESAHAASGPMMLRQAALDAIQNARYTPYQLNGSPTEVQTTITVNFKLST